MKTNEEIAKSLYIELQTKPQCYTESKSIAVGMIKQALDDKDSSNQWVSVDAKRSPKGRQDETYFFK